jgi:GT2 family glycosyltransferase
MGAPRTGVVIATRDRAASLLAVLQRLRALPEGPPVVVVDNGSTDGTPEAVRAAAPEVVVLEAGRNLGAAARTLGARALDTTYVAFNDDDSWWAPGALLRAAELLDVHPRVGLLAARVLVGPAGRLDPTCAAMARSPLPRDALPGPGVLGFVACGAVVRRTAFLEVGGFDERYGIGGEERRLALDLAAAGWALAYADELVVHHVPDAGGLPRSGRLRRQARNDLWSAWLRRPAAAALRESALVLARLARREPATAAQAAADALGGARWVVRERRVVPQRVEQGLRAIDRVG